LTHAAIYEASPKINGVIHIHNLQAWEKYKNKLPTTNENIEYGTPEMATEIFRLFRETNAIEEKIIIMGGHKEGIIVFGENLEEAGDKLKILL
jgi:ribulose-5-phosphate 4-epimerase/fuculose-1-phosphate aldolase